MADIVRWSPFRQLSTDSQRLLGRERKTVSCKANETLLRKGQAVAGAYLVLSGRLRVFSIAPNGNQSTLYTVDSGETCVFALNCLFNDLLYPAWVEAEQTTTLVIIPNTLYRRLFEREPVIQDLTIRALSTAAFRLIATLEQVQGLSLEQRLANLILSHAASDGRLRMTQQQMAQHLGTSREVVARLIAKFSSQGWIRTQRGLLAIESVEHLVRLVSVAAH